MRAADSPARRSNAWLGMIALVSLAAVAAALVSQHVFDMQPCPWCVLQRVIFVAIAIACVIGLVLRNGLGRGLSALLVLLLSLSGVAAALWQHFVAAATASCNLTLADRIVSGLGLDGWAPEVFQARASCADAAVKVLGVPYEFFSLALFVVFALAALRLLRR
ncbi:disulfide bond formation protein B [Aquincola tertiaricarbonis]|uniref:Disulfide bond formation protein B n=1 Tax=Aquincola tertiaricarbonis TaxID=391953 RepID=A0ABY4SBK3_AQUTE|nr:disulfide bond formation protein B [Aquincola tertiaricarbonis]URI09123.1 disulfide bond formation protein B [Aquincola tertiaricarbonis]